MSDDPLKHLAEKLQSWYTLTLFLFRNILWTEPQQEKEACNKHKNDFGSISVASRYEHYCSGQKKTDTNPFLTIIFLLEVKYVFHVFKVVATDGFEKRNEENFIIFYFASLLQYETKLKKGLLWVSESWFMLHCVDGVRMLAACLRDSLMYGFILLFLMFTISVSSIDGYTVERLDARDSTALIVCPLGYSLH